MKTLSELIKENESSKKFKYNATVQVEGHVYAENEGNAGELVDKEMDLIPGLVSYEIINIEEDSSEGYINPDLAIASEILENDNSSYIQFNVDELYNDIQDKLDIIIDENVKLSIIKGLIDKLQQSM